MKKLFASLIVSAALIGSLTAAQAQLVSIDKSYRVSKVDREHNRLEVHNMNDRDLTLFVDVDGDTQALNMNRGHMSWRKLRVGDVVQVKGGLELGGQIKAKTIILQNG